MLIRWSDPALHDLEDIVSWIRQENAAAALKVAAHIFSEVESLRAMSLRGRQGVVPGTRELVLLPTPYIAVYETTIDEVLILRVRHAARNWP